MCIKFSVQMVNSRKGERERRRNELCVVHHSSEEGLGQLSAVGLDGSAPLSLGGALHQ